MKNIKIYIAGVVGITCVGACLFTGCFSVKQEEINIPTLNTQVKMANYKQLVNDWNGFVNKMYLDDSYYLPRDNNKAVVVKLNKLLHYSNRVEEFKKQNTCILKYPNKSIFQPSFEYMKFLEKYNNVQDISFDLKVNEHQIIARLKDITNSRYFDENIVKIIASLDSFEYFFKYHKKEFYKDGFTKNITRYKQYQEVIQKCK